MKKIFLALMAMAAITMIGCKPVNPPTSPEHKLLDLDSVVLHDYSYAQQMAAGNSLAGVELMDVTFFVDKSFDTAKVEDMLIDTIITKFVLGEQKILTCKHVYNKNGIEVGDQSQVIDGVISRQSFKPEDVKVTWYDAIRVIQENCPALKGCSASINRSVYPEIENRLVYNFSVLDVVDAQTGEYIDCTPAPPM